MVEFSERYVPDIRVSIYALLLFGRCSCVSMMNCSFRKRTPFFYMILAVAYARRNQQTACCYEAAC